MQLMSDRFVEKTSQELLARRLEEHIHRQGLEPGERYLTASSAAEFFGVNRMAVDRAMTLLAQRNMLVRRRGRGTFVGPAVRPAPKTTVTHVHFIHCGEGEFSAPPIPTEMLLSGLRETIPDAILHTHLFPYDQAAVHVRELVESFAGNDNRRAVVLALSPREVQQEIARRELPAVVVGGVFPGIPLPNIEADQFEIGRNLVRLARRLGAGRFLFVNREHWRYGDSRAFDGMVRELAELGLPADRISIRNYPKDAALASALFGDIAAAAVSDSTDKKAAILCRTASMAELIRRAAKSHGLHIPDDLLIVHNRHWNDEAEITRPYVAERISEEETLAQIGRMLKTGLGEDTTAIQPFRIPVSIIE